METIRCPTCQLAVNILEPGEYYTLPPDIRDLVDKEEREHAPLHATIASNLLRFGFTTHGPWEAEEERRLAWEDMQSQHSAIRVQGAERLVRYFFYKSILCAAELGYSDQHPDEEDFGKLLLLRTFLTKDLADRLRKEYGPQSHFIDPKTQRWEPGGVRPIEAWTGDPNAVSP